MIPTLFGALSLALSLTSALGAGPVAPFAHFTVAADTQLAKHPVKAGEDVKTDGLVQTGPAGRARIELLPSKSVIQIGPNSSFILARGEPEKTLEMVQTAGLIRWKVNQRSKNGVPTFRVRTQAAAMGVRGTDFMTVYNPILDEAEVVVFEGEVELQSLSDASDKKTIPKEHWGGVGGRYGRKIGDLIHLSPIAIETFDKRSRVE